MSSYSQNDMAARAPFITVTTTALDRVSGVVCGDACVPGIGCGLQARVSLWAGLVLRLVCEVLVSVSCVSRLPPRVFEQSLNRYGGGPLTEMREVYR